jgi:polar amino acid transport system permease protein
VKSGQRTAAIALGMKGSQVMRHVVIPQAARIVLPPIGNQMIGMLKLSALVSVIAVEDLLLVANQTASSNFKYFEALTAAGIYYLGLTTIFMILQSLLERSLDPKSRARMRNTSLTERLLQAPGRQIVR